MISFIMLVAVEVKLPEDLHTEYWSLSFIRIERAHFVHCDVLTWEYFDFKLLWPLLQLNLQLIKHLCCVEYLQRFAGILG